MMIIQFILVVFFLFALLKVSSRYRSKELKVSEAIGWVLFWVAAILVVANPNSTTMLAKILGVGRGVDAVMYLSIAFLFFLVFKIFAHLEKIESQITKLVRKETLGQSKKYESSTRNS